MAKTKLYYKNGIAYFKAGGRFYPLPKAQGGGASGSFETMSSPSVGQVETIGTSVGGTEGAPTGGMSNQMLAGIGNLAATGIGMLTPQRNSGVTPSSETSAAMKGYGNDRFESGVGTLMNTASSLDPTGTMGIVNAAMNVSKAIGKGLRREDENGIANNEGIGGKLMTAYGNAFDPIGNIQRSINIGKKHGAWEGIKNFATLGNSGTDLMEEDLKRAEDRAEGREMASRQGLNTGNYRNDSVYAKRGVNLQSVPTLTNKRQPNVEIEDGEILLGNPGTTTKYGNTFNSLTSKYATKFHGDKHGQDTDGDGMEGIPLNTENGYIASNYLGMDGRPVKKQKGGKSGKTVADEMTPLVEYLHKAEQNSQDVYQNNPIAIKEVLRQLEGMKNTAEQNKFRRELEKMIKNDQVPLEDVLMFIQENAPQEDMSPEQMQALQGLMQQQQGQMMQQQQMQQQNMPSPQDQLAMMGQQAEQLPQAPMAKKGLNMLNRYQQGGPMEQGGPEQNMSNQHMMQLMQQAQQQVGPQQEGMMVPALQELDPQVQEMFAQLPPEMQEEIAQIQDPQQMEVAIINAFRQVQQESQGQEMPQEGMEGQPGEEEMMAAMQAEQQALMKMGGSLNEYYGDRFRDANRVDYNPSQDAKSANAHLPRPVQLEGHFNPQTKTHMKQMGAFQDNYQTGGSINNTAIDGRVMRLAEQIMQQYQAQGQDMDQRTAIELAQRKLAQEAPEMKAGGMIGKPVTFKVGGKIHQGIIDSFDPKTGKFTIR